MRSVSNNAKHLEHHQITAHGNITFYSSLRRRELIEVDLFVLRYPVL